MTRDYVQDKRFPFLHSHIAREPHIFDILNEIMTFQHNVRKTGIGHFAAMEDLKTSRNIKIPFTFMRNKTITTLVGLLAKNYPDQFKSLITFFFSVEPETKKLSIIENREYTVLLSNDEYNRYQDERNRRSLVNFLNLISQFRLFNLTKLLRKTKERALLSQIIKNELGMAVFTFKNYIINKQNNEITEDFCFHKDNYNAVRKTMAADKIKNIISNHTVPISRRLKKFGILNPDFDDYKDNKLEYILNILLEDIPSSLSTAELTDVKNFSSLRSCLLKVETLIDPLITASGDIAAYVKENYMSTIGTLASIFTELTEDKLLKWAAEQSARYKILTYKDEEGITYLIDGEQLLPRFSELHDKILYQQENLDELGYYEKEKMFDEFSILCNAGKNLLNSEEKLKSVIGIEDDIKLLRQLIEEYEGYQKSIALDSAMAREERNASKKRSILSAIAEFLLDLFTFKKESAPLRVPREERGALHEGRTRTFISKDIKSILYRIKNSQENIIPLSNYIELLPANESNIEILINDIRRLNLKIVIPIYGARKILYPNRSKQYLIPDIEYLLLPTETLQSPELIREYTDSITGEKLKDEKIPPAFILNIEKYLLNIYNQKKAMMHRKGKPKK